MNHQSQSCSCAFCERSSPAQINALIDTHRYLVVPTCGEPHYAFTIGLWRHRLPELILMGMSGRQAYGVLTIVAEHMLAQGPIAAGTIDTDLMTGPSRFDAVPAGIVDEKMALALTYAPLSISDFPVLQLVWPDREGRFPDDPGFSREFAGRQVILRDQAVAA